MVVVSYEVFSYLGPETESPGDYHFWVEVVINLNHVALAVNAAVNIVIYICKDKKFRAAFVELLPKWVRCCYKASPGQAWSRSLRRKRSGDNNNTSGEEEMVPLRNLPSTAETTVIHHHHRLSSQVAALTPRRDIVIEKSSNGYAASVAVPSCCQPATLRIQAGDDENTRSKQSVEQVENKGDKKSLFDASYV